MKNNNTYSLRLVRGLFTPCYRQDDVELALCYGFVTRCLGGSRNHLPEKINVTVSLAPLDSLNVMEVQVLASATNCFSPTAWKYANGEIPDTQNYGMYWPAQEAVQKLFADAGLPVPFGYTTVWVKVEVAA